MTTALQHPRISGTDAVWGGTPLPEHGTTRRSKAGTLALAGLRLTIGFEFLWAFFDKVFGFGWATPSARAWVNGGSPTKGFLAGAGGPFQDAFHWLSGTPGTDWLFMAGLLGIGTALLLGVALRPAAASGGLLLMLMYLATWPFAKMADGEPTHSTNPIIDSHVINTFALVVIATLAGRSLGVLGKRWASLPLVQRQPWLR